MASVSQSVFHGPGYYRAEDCRLEDFAALTGRRLAAAEVPQAGAIERNIPVYDMARLRPALEDPGARRALMAEWARVLRDSAGVLMLQRAYGEVSAIDAASAVYRAIIVREKRTRASGADHFAAAGKNDRIWNSLQKLCEQAPKTFVDYFANPAVDAVCEAWLGPNYQMTAQVNVVYPGGAAQQAHRDYHLGFQTAEVCAGYPAHVHELSAALTLQGAIAHCDMPVESGPTKLLPFSQLYRPGYAAWRRDDFSAHFEAQAVQVPLRKGDALFFNPALFHAAGANVSADVERMANLLQISSAFGRAMETIDRDAMCRLLYPPVLAAQQEGRLSPLDLKAVLAASAEGYSFPTNLDSDPPDDGLAPESQQALFHRAVAETWPAEAFEHALGEIRARQRA